MTDERSKKMLMTIRAALIMAAKAIEEYCKEDKPSEYKVESAPNVTFVVN